MHFAADLTVDRWRSQSQANDHRLGSRWDGLRYRCQRGARFGMLSINQPSAQHVLVEALRQGDGSDRDSMLHAFVDDCGLKPRCTGDAVAASSNQLRNCLCVRQSYANTRRLRRRLSVNITLLTAYEDLAKLGRI